MAFSAFDMKLCDSIDGTLPKASRPQTKNHKNTQKLIRLPPDRARERGLGEEAPREEGAFMNTSANNNERSKITPADGLATQT